MKFVLWGAGDRGERILFHIGKENVLAIIDSDEKKQGKKYFGVDVISYKQYKEDYDHACIVITTAERTIANILMRDHNFKFLYMNDCPEDFQSPNPRNILKNNILRQVQKDNRYVVYGNNLYTLLLYRWLMEFGVEKAPYLVTGTAISDELFQVFREFWGNNVFHSLKELDGIELDRIYVTTHQQNDELRENRERVFDLYLYSEKIPEYYNPRIKKFKGIHEGKRCFIIGTGPNLLTSDLEKLKKNHEICISLNFIFKIFSDTSWRPDYYVAQDFAMMRDFQHEVLKNLDGIPMFISDGYAPFCQEQHPENIYINHMACYGYEDEEIPFSEDFAQICYISGSVSYSCIQLAAYMGFKEIYLVGIDWSGINPEREMSHFDGEVWTDLPANQFRAGYVSAKKYADSHGIKIYNASRGGDLELYERVDLDVTLSKNYN